MPPLSRQNLNRIEELYRSFMSQLDMKNGADRFVWGTLIQSFPHFIIRSVPNMGSRDIDQIYQSRGKNVAIVSLIRGKWPNESDERFHNEISELLSIPLYWINFNNDWNEFRIYDSNFLLWYILNRDEFMRWSELLSNEESDLILLEFGEPKMEICREER